MSAVLVLTGRLTRREPVEGLRVLVTHPGSKNPRWTARLGRDGRFSVTAEDLAELRTSTDDSVPLIVRVLNGGHGLARTRVNVPLDDPVPAKLHLIVPERDGIWASGSVRTSRGRPAPGTDSAVSRVLLDGQRVLGRARTDEEGRSETLVEKPGEWLDLKVGVVDGGSEIVTGLVHCELRSELVEDLTVPDDRVLARVQLDQLSGRFTSVLAADPVHLDDAGVDVAAGRLEGPVEVVQGLRENARWQAAGAPAGAALALADTGELDPVSVLSRSGRDLAHQLEAAVESSHIAGLARPLSEAGSALRRSAAELALDRPAGRRRRSRFESLGVSADLAREVVRGELLGELGEEVWDALAGDHSARSVQWRALARICRGWGSVTLRWYACSPTVCPTRPASVVCCRAFRSRTSTGCSTNVSKANRWGCPTRWWPTVEIAHQKLQRAALAPIRMRTGCICADMGSIDA